MTIEAPILLCAHCAFYKEGDIEMYDICTHPKATKSAVREVTFYYCGAMRAGICGLDAKLFQRTLPVMPGSSARTRSYLTETAGDGNPHHPTTTKGT